MGTDPAGNAARAFVAVQVNWDRFARPYRREDSCLKGDIVGDDACGCNAGSSGLSVLIRPSAGDHIAACSGHCEPPAFEPKYQRFRRLRPLQHARTSILPKALRIGERQPRDGDIEQVHVLDRNVGTRLGIGDEDHGPKLFCQSLNDAGAEPGF